MKPSYAALKTAGLCVRCGLTRPEDDSVTCQSCRDAVNSRRVGQVQVRVSSVSFNVCCQAHGFHRDGCVERP